MFGYVMNIKVVQVEMRSNLVCKTSQFLEKFIDINLV